MGGALQTLMRASSYLIDYTTSFRKAILTFLTAGWCGRQRSCLDARSHLSNVQCDLETSIQSQPEVLLAMLGLQRSRHSVTNWRV